MSVDEKDLVAALDNDTQPVLYFNPTNTRGQVIGYEQNDPEGQPLFTVEVEGHGVYQGVSVLELFDDREPEYSDEPEGPATDWAWTQTQGIESIEDQIKGVT